MKATVALLLLCSAFTTVIAACPTPVQVPVVLAQDFTGCAACPEVTASLLAVHEVNTLQRRIMGSAVDTLVDDAGCALVQLQAQLLDTKHSPMHTMQVATASYLNPATTVAFIGGTSSRVLYPLASTASAYGILTVADSSTAVAVGESSAFSHVARLALNDRHLARALQRTFAHFQWGACGLITTSNDVYGESVTESVITTFAPAGIKVAASATFALQDRASMKAALAAIKASAAQIIIVTLYDSEAEMFFDAAAELGMIGHTFVLTDALSDPLSVASNRTQLAARMAGSLVMLPAVVLQIDPSSPQQKLPTQWAGLDPADPASVGSLITARGLPATYFSSVPATSPLVADAYDAVWATALAAAKVARRNMTMTGNNVYAQLTNASFAFTGTSGGVSFSSSGERTAEAAAAFPVYNLVAGSWVPVAGASASSYTPIRAVTWASGTSVTPIDGLTCPAAHLFATEFGVCAPVVGAVMDLGTTGPPWQFMQQYIAGTLLVFDLANHANDIFLPVFGTLTTPVLPRMISSGWFTSELVENTMLAVLADPGVVSVGGAVGSDGSTSLSPLMTALQLPLVSAWSTSSALTDKAQHPFLVRNVTPDSIAARAIAEVMAHYGFRRVAVMAIQDSYGAAFAADFAFYAGLQGITIVSSTLYNEGSAADTALAVRTTASTNAKVFLLITFGGNSDVIIRTAQEEGVLGRGYAWFSSDGLSPTAYVNYPSFTSMPRGLGGFIRLLPTTTQSDGLDKLATWWATQDASSEYWIKLQDDAGIKPSNRITQATFEGSLDSFLPMVMDSMLQQIVVENRMAANASVVASPETRLAELLRTEFAGFSGYVKLDSTTHDRDPATISVVVESFVYDNVTNTVSAETVATWADGITLLKPITWPGGLTSAPNDGSSCPEGWFVDDVTLQCAACDPGYHYDTTTAACKPCEPGTFAPTAGLVQCVACASIGGYAPASGATQCRSCPDLTEQLPAAAGVHVTDCVCVKGTFHPEGKSGEPCLPCPPGAVCDGYWAPPVAMQGFWRFGEKHETFLKCPGSEACQGAPEDEVVRATSKVSNSSMFPTGCAEGYRGTLCASCDVGYGRSSKRGCTKCNNVGWLLVLLIFVCLLIVALMTYLIVKAIGSQGRIQANAILRKIFISHAQVMGILLNVELEWPGPVKALFEVQNLVGSPANEEWILADCSIAGDNRESRFLRSQFIFAAAPLAIVLVVIVIVLAWTKYRNVCCRKMGRKGQRGSAMLRHEQSISVLTTRDYVILSLVIIFYTMHPFLTRRALLMFSCDTFDSRVRSGAFLQEESYSLVAEDLEVSCSSPQWLQAQVLLGGPMALLFVLGVPLLLWHQLHKYAYKSAHLTQRTRVVFGFLFLGFERQYYFWEIITMTRKALLAGIAVFMSGRSQLISAALVLTLALVAQMGSTPYQNTQMDHVETVSLAVQTLTLLFGQYFFEGVLIQEATRTAATTIIFFLNAGFLVWMVWISVVTIRADMKSKHNHVSAYSTRNISLAGSGMNGSDWSVAAEDAVLLPDLCCCKRKQAAEQSPVGSASSKGTPAAVAARSAGDAPVFVLAQVDEGTESHGDSGDVQDVSDDEDDEARKQVEEGAVIDGMTLLDVTPTPTPIASRTSTLRLPEETKEAAGQDPIHLTLPNTPTEEGPGIMLPAPMDDEGRLL